MNAGGKLRANERSETALSEFPSGRRWTFAELADAVEKLPAAGEPFVFAQGHSAEFIFDVLRAWRDRAVLCPLEIGQPKPALPVPPKPACHLKLTSATTGPARAVVFTAEQLAADAENIVATMGLRPDWPNLGAISLAHSYGFSNLVLPLLLHGIPLVMVASPLPEIVRRAAENLSGLTLAAVPALWRTWHETNAIPATDPARHFRRRAVAGGLERDIFQARGLKIHNFYGSSECGGIAYDATETPRDRRRLRRLAHAQCDARLQRRRLPARRQPRRGTGLLAGAGRRAGSGNFPDQRPRGIPRRPVFLRGRLSDQINVAGRKVSPAAIEQILATHPAVRECIVFGVPGNDADRNETIAAAVVVRRKLPPPN